MTSVLWLTRYGHEGASSRYRVHQFVEPLKLGGIRSSTRPLARWQSSRTDAARTVASRLVDLGKKPVDDVVVIQKEPVMPAQLWPIARQLVRRIDVPIVWDIDDAIWVHGAAHERMARDIARIGTCVVAGNDLIAEWARSVGARSVTVIPTCYEPATAPPRPRREASDGVRIVWLGSPSTAQLLEHEVRRLRFLASLPRVQMKFIGGCPPEEIRDLPNVEVLDWSPEVEHRQLVTADFGLALQPRTPFADHKCGFKIVQYMAYGVVPIATDNPVHRQMIADSGLLVDPDTTDGLIGSFVARGSTDERRTAVQNRWRQMYSVDVGAQAWSRLIREVAG